MSMKYFSQYSGLLPDPEVERPDLSFRYTNVEEYEKKMEAYNNWRSQEVKVLPKDRAIFKGFGDVELKEGVHYVVGYQICSMKNEDWKFVHYGEYKNPAFTKKRLVAIPLSQNEREEIISPAEEPQADSVVSHSCTSGNSIRHGLKVIIDDLRAEIAGAGVNLLESGLTQKERGYYVGVQIVCKDIIVKLATLLNRTPNAAVSDTTGDEQGDVDGIKKQSK